MWSGNERTPLICSLNLRNVLVIAKLCIALSTFLLAFCYGFTISLLIILICTTAYYLPVILIYFNDIHFGHGLERYRAQTDAYRKSTKPSHEPYYLIEGDMVPLQVNEAVEKFFNSLLEKYVLPWQTSFDVQENQFILELRHIIKYFIIQLHQRLQAVDLSNLVIYEIVPLFLWHVHCFSVVTAESREVEKHVLSRIGDHLHPAIHTRKTEETYLRNVSERLVKIILPSQLTDCRLFTILIRDIVSNLVLQKTFDTIADPDTINQLIIVGLKNGEKKEFPEMKEAVRFLENFAKYPVEVPQTYLYPKLSEVLKAPSYLYHLMQFMKRERSLKYLQFIFAVDEFNEKLLNPDIDLEQMHRLQTMGRRMFEMYFNQGSPDSIGFSNDSIEQMNLIVHGELNDIVRLRTSPTLFQAYEHVVDIMEKTIIPRFYRSSEFYRHWIGSQNSETTPKSQRRKAGSSNSGWLKKLRSAITPNWLSSDAKSATVEEDLIIDDTGIDLTEASVIPDDPDMELEEEPSYVEVPVMGRNLSSWRTSIPKVVSAVDSSGRPGWALEVDIQRLDLRPGDDPEDFHWTVVRTYNEFYVLETKLTEFHGDLPVRLPPKKMFGTREFGFLQSMRPDFETYLRVLLTVPALKGSDLVFSFLTLSDLSSCHAIGDKSVNILPNIGLGKMLRNVPMKLRKERGQDLDNFTQKLIASTITPRPKPPKSETKESSSVEVSVPIIKELHRLYKDNVKSFLPDEEKGKRSLPRQVTRYLLSGPYDCLLFLVMEVWRLPRLASGVLLGLQSLLAVYFNSWIHKCVSEMLSRALHPLNVSFGINLLHDTIFEGNPPDNGSPRENYLTAWNMVRELPHPWFEKILGQEIVENRLNIMFRCLQYPILNKQLSYVIFDVLVTAIFPEVFEEMGDESNSEP